MSHEIGFWRHKIHRCKVEDAVFQSAARRKYWSDFWFWFKVYLGFFLIGGLVGLRLYSMWKGKP